MIITAEYKNSIAWRNADLLVEIGAIDAADRKFAYNVYQNLIHLCDSYNNIVQIEGACLSYVFSHLDTIPEFLSELLVEILDRVEMIYIPSDNTIFIHFDPDLDNDQEIANLENFLYCLGSLKLN